MFIVSLYVVGSAQVETAWDFGTREKAEEFMALFTEKCSDLLPGEDLSEKFTLHVVEVPLDPVSSFEEMFAIWQSKARPEWLGETTAPYQEVPGDAGTPTADPVELSVDFLDDLLESLERQTEQAGDA